MANELGVSDTTVSRETSPRRSNFRTASQIRIADAVASFGLMFVLASAFRPFITAYMSIGAACELLDKCVFVALLLYPLVVRRSPSCITFATLLFCLAVCFSSFINGNLNQNVLYSNLRIALLIYYFQVQFERFPRRLLSVAFFVLAVICLWDILSVALCPSGLFQDVRYENEYHTVFLKGWVLGLKNNHILWFLSLNLVSTLLDWSKSASIRPSFRTVLCYAMTIATTSTMGSSTSTVVLSVLLLLLCLEPILGRARHIFNPRNVCVVLILAWAFLVLSSSLSILNGFLMDAFGKDASFSGRNLAWSETLRLILDSPIVGYGTQSATQRALMLGSVEYVNAHNQLLELLYVGGLPLACIAAFLPLLVSKPPAGAQVGCAHRMIVCMVFIALGIEMLFEVIMTIPAFWFILLLAHYGCVSMPRGGVSYGRL